MPTPPAPYQGDFIAWQGVCGFLGEGSGPVPPHAHYAIQIVLGMPTGLRVQFGRHGAWQNCQAALIPSRATHAIDVTDCAWSCVLFIEPDTPQGKALAARLQGKMEILSDAAIATGAARLHDAWQAQQDRDAVNAACLEIVHDLTCTASREPSDPRILAAIAYLRERPSQPASLAELAQAAHLSPSRFRHLFVQETGIPLRTYLLWRRLLQVWVLLTQGESLSAAAHAAGFADSAHLSRTSRTMFGLAPSTLHMGGPLARRARGDPRHRG